MWPHIGPHTTYPFVYLVMVIAFFIVCHLAARRLHLKRRVWIALGICYLLSMSVGAKVAFDVLRGHFSVTALFSSHHWMEGGMWGGPLVFLALAVPLVLLLAGNRRDGLDLIALSLPIPMILAKVACFCQGCCNGRRCSLPWAVTFPKGGSAPAGIPLHPTQIYEILVLVCVLVILSRLDHKRWQGMLLLWFLAVYGLGRAAVETWRGDLQNRILVGPFSFSQMLCAAAALLSILLLILFRRRARIADLETEQLPKHN